MIQLTEEQKKNIDHIKERYTAIIKFVSEVDHIEAHEREAVIQELGKSYITALNIALINCMNQYEITAPENKTDNIIN